MWRCWMAAPPTSSNRSANKSAIDASIVALSAGAVLASGFPMVLHCNVWRVGGSIVGPNLTNDQVQYGVVMNTFWFCVSYLCGRPIGANCIPILQWASLASTKQY